MVICMPCVSTHHHISLCFCVNLCMLIFSDTRDIRDSGALSKLKMDKYELPVQEIKTATELDLSNKGLGKLDAIVIAMLITVCKLQNRFVTNQIAYRPLYIGQWGVVLVGH